METAQQLLTRWLDKLPFTWLALLAAWLAVAPLVPEPHLIEKLRMLVQGTLVRPLDVFDLQLVQFLGFRADERHVVSDVFEIVNPRRRN